MCVICTGEYNGETILDCSGCKSLTSLPSLPNVISLDCSRCTSLTSLPSLSSVTFLYCRGCTWLDHRSNFKYSNNIVMLVKIERWYKRMIWYRYIKSKEFVEWCYHPDNIGGRQAKKSIHRYISNKVI